MLDLAKSCEDVVNACVTRTQAKGTLSGTFLRDATDTEAWGTGRTWKLRVPGTAAVCLCSHSTSSNLLVNRRKAARRGGDLQTLTAEVNLVPLKFSKCQVTGPSQILVESSQATIPCKDHLYSPFITSNSTTEDYFEISCPLGLLAVSASRFIKEARRGRLNPAVPAQPSIQRRCLLQLGCTSGSSSKLSLATKRTLATSACPGHKLDPRSESRSLLTGDPRDGLGGIMAGRLH